MFTSQSLARRSTTSPGVLMPDEPTHVRGPRTSCYVCGGAQHRHGGTVQSNLTCWWYQFSKTKLPAGRGIDPTPGQLREFADWLASGNARKRPPRNLRPGEEPPTDPVYF
jgi:hypothetical protein